MNNNYGKRQLRKKERAVLNGQGRMSRKAGVFVFNAILIGIVIAVIFGASTALGAFRGLLSSAPDIGNLSVTPKGFSTFVYDAEGNQIAKLVSSDSNRIPVTMDMIPKHLKDAFVAIEDQRFYEHNGIDVEGIIRAFVTGVGKGFQFDSGASTITQQLLKNNVFTNWTSEQGSDKYRRKIQEQYLAVQLERTMSKEDILLNYLNTINLGQNTLGVQAASLRYFGKSVSELTLSESAVIAAITQNPSRWNPISHPENNAGRRETVLRYMREQGMITDEEYDEAMADDVYARIQAVDAETEDVSVNSYFVDALTSEIIDDLIELGYNETQAYVLLYSSGLKIFSTQDPAIQSICDEIYSDPASYPEYVRYQLDYALTVEQADGTIVNHSTEKFLRHFQQENPSYTLLYSGEEAANEAVEKYHEAVLEEGDSIVDERITLVPQPQVSLVVEDQHTGYVVALVGGRGVKEASRTLNRATDSVRQPGSTFKVVSTYAPALDSAGMTLATVINDAPFNYANGRPVRNHWGDTYRGLYTFRNAIRDSANVVTVKALTWITPQLGFDYLKNMGFTTLVESKEITNSEGKTEVFSDIQQSLALGGITNGVKNIELNASYAMIANGGAYIKPKLYSKVVDHDGNVILDNTDPEQKQVLKPTTAWLLTSAMEDVVKSGTGTSVNFGTTPIAGKTGTTTSNNDVWFCGYTDYYTATTWTGYDNNTKLGKGETALSRSLWRKVMERIHKDLPAREFKMPDGIVQKTVCSQSGKLPVSGMCDGHLVTEYFASDTVPTETCDVHFAGDMCGYTGRAAADLCPFKIHGAAYTLAPAEPPALQQGSGGSTTTVTETSRCPHDASFYAQPNAQQTLALQMYELMLRNGHPENDNTVAAATQFAIDTMAQVAGGGTPTGAAATPAPAETPAEETPAETPAEGEGGEAPAAEQPAETPPAEEQPAETPPAETPPAEETPAEQPAEGGE